MPTGDTFTTSCWTWPEPEAGRRRALRRFGHPRALAAVLLTSTGIIRVVVAVIAFVIAVCIWLFVFRNNNNIHPLPHEKPADESGEADSKNE